MPFGEDTVGTLYATTVDGERVFIGEATLSEVDTYLEEYQYVRVVRCKDCKHWRGHCLRGNDGSEDWYCADAERREDG